MRSEAPSLAPIFRSEHQLAILASLFLYGGEWTMSELAAHAGVSLSTASREVHRLADNGLVTITTRGQLRLVRANLDLPWAAPLTGLLDQTVGPMHHLRALLEEPAWSVVEEAHLFGSWARRHQGERGPQPNDLDVVLVAAQPLSTAEVIRFQRELEARVHLRVDAFAVSRDDWDHPSKGGAVADLQAGPTVSVRRIQPRADWE